MDRKSLNDPLWWDKQLGCLLWKGLSDYPLPSTDDLDNAKKATYTAEKKLHIPKNLTDTDREAYKSSPHQQHCLLMLYKCKFNEFAIEAQSWADQVLEPSLFERILATDVELVLPGHYIWQLAFEARQHMHFFSVVVFDMLGRLDLVCNLTNLHPDSPQFRGHECLRAKNAAIRTELDREGRALNSKGNDLFLLQICIQKNLRYVVPESLKQAIIYQIQCRRTLALLHHQVKEHVFELSEVAEAAGWPFKKPSRAF